MVIILGDVTIFVEDDFAGGEGINDLVDFGGDIVGDGFVEGSQGLGFVGKANGVVGPLDGAGLDFGDGFDEDVVHPLLETGQNQVRGQMALIPGPADGIDLAILFGGFDGSDIGVVAIGQDEINTAVYLGDGRFFGFGDVHPGAGVGHRDIADLVIDQLGGGLEGGKIGGDGRDFNRADPAELAG